MADKPDVTLARWASDETNNDPPSSGQRDTGWTEEQDGVSDYDNAIKFELYKWALYLSELELVFPMILRTSDGAKKVRFDVIDNEKISVRNAAGSDKGDVDCRNLTAVKVAAGGLTISNIISPSALDGSGQDNWDPTGFDGTTGVIRINGGSGDAITGIVDGGAGRVLVLCHVGGDSVHLRGEDAGSSAGNQFYFGGAGEDITLTVGDCVTLMYDGSLLKWLCIGKHVK